MRFEIEEIRRPNNDDKKAWGAYWKAKGQPWRWEPEIDKERQKYLAQRRSIEPDWKQDIHPFKDIKLTRADVEWLLATHEDGRGPVDWSDESQREREGLYLVGVDLRHVNLGSLPLAKTFLRRAHLEGAFLLRAQLEKADLCMTELQEAELALAKLQGANLSEAQLEKTNLCVVELQGANLSGAQLEKTKLNDVGLADEHHVGPQLADVQWGDTNLAVVDWEQVTMLGDEHEAQQKLRENGGEKPPFLRSEDYNTAARAHRQLSVALRNQGLNEDAARFAYRGQLMQRKVFWYQRQFGQYLGSLFLDLLSGYGYRVGRCFIVYALVIGVFATIYHLLGAHPAWNEAIVISMTAFHGRGFFPDQFHPGDPQALAAAIEALVGLLIEITLIVTLTQRLFGK